MRHNRSAPKSLAAAFANIHPEVAARYYGCGLVAPDFLAGARILDLGSGAGRDVYALAQLTGENGAVVGVDMTDAQLAVARSHTQWHKEKFGYAEANTTFLEGDIEKLEALDLEDQSFDVIVSNCVINLCQDKQSVFTSAYRLLKPGGEMYFADVYADRVVPHEAMQDPRAHGECLAGALYWRDFVDLAKAVGFADPRLVAHRPLAIHDTALAELLSPAQFQSATYRLIKAPDLGPDRHDRDHRATFKGGGTLSDALVFDRDLSLLVDAPTRICANTAAMIRASRFNHAVEIEGGDAAATPFMETLGPSPFDGPQPAAPTSSSCCS